MQAWSDGMRTRGKLISLVPTMGFLHEGHLSLFRKGKEKGDVLAASIFVNPTQFAPGEDFESYPRNMERDLALSEKEGVDVVFMPERSRLYPERFQTYVNLKRLPNHLCGLSRPIFLRGVATVVTKLFNIVKPHFAVFGEKDYQQLLVIRQMTADLDFDIEIVSSPIVRETDGLAMSSRNAYLSGSERKQALCLSQSLNEAQKLVEGGETAAEKITAAAKECISAHPDTVIDYIAVCDPETLEKVDIIDGKVLMALAVKVGTTRLIDNRIL